MGSTLIDVKKQLITTNDGQKFIRRVKTIRMPNGRYRYPVDYYDATPGPVIISEAELQRKRIPIYDYMI